MSVQTVLAFDYGTVRIGAAVGNTLLRQATPVAMIAAQPKAARWAAIAALIDLWQPECLVVGIARHASGEPSMMTARCERFAHQLEGRFARLVYRIDERYSSLDAEALQREARAAGRARRHSALDHLAAAAILTRFFEEQHAAAS